MMNTEVLGSNIPAQNNPQLQEPPLQIDMDPNNVDNTKIRGVQVLSGMCLECIAKIQQMNLNVRQNQRLQKYFAKAGTNRNEILSVLAKLIEDMLIIKDSIPKKQTNIVVINEVIIFLHHILASNNINKMKNIQKAIWIVEFEAKVICSMEFIMKSINIPYDITTSKKERYENVWKFVKVEKFGNAQKIKSSLAFTKKVLAITTSACLNSQKREWAISKLVTFGLSYPQYFFSDKQGQLASMVFYRRPTIQMARTIWNLPQNGMTRQFSKLQMKSIESNFKIYIPYNESKQPTDILVDDGQSIQVRVLHNNKIYLKNKQKKSSIFGFCTQQPHEEPQIKTIILHMHGGGFLALSSRSMQIYTRRWARDLSVPVFSIDYRMPPQHRFPTAPQDCLKVYKFLIQKISKYLNVNPQKIILAGDSAGGNLSFALTGLIMKQGLPLPQGIFAAYPACNLRKLFSPSKLFAFTDPLLNPSMLLLCLRQYLDGKQQNQLDPIASPVLLTEQFIGGQQGDKRFPLKWPKTIIQVGAQDPLYDDSLKIMQRMVSSNIDCQCHVYDNLSHGFLNLQFIIPECTATIKDSIKMLSKLLN